MMQYASVGVRNAARKASNGLIHNKAHHSNGPGGSTTNSRRNIHLSTNLFSVSPASTLNAIPNLASIRPRNPSHKLFSASKNFLQRFITHLTTPGFRAPTFFNDIVRSSRSLYNPNLHRASIQNGFSLPVRNALHTSALRRQANTFLPRGNGPVAVRCGGVSQVGLGTARNFSTGRPIFQHLVENVPVACRAIYELDVDLKLPAKRREAMRNMINSNGIVERSKERVKAKSTPIKTQEECTTESTLEEDMEQYFALDLPPVSTYLLVPLAPTPTSRAPLPANLVDDDVNLLPPLAELGAIRTSHSTHALRVSTLFMRLDQANVWARGVSCSAYSQGQQYRHHQTDSIGGKDEDINIGSCTILKVEFIGWTKAEVRGVIGESGSGWCVLEEVWHNDCLDEHFSDTDSLASDTLDLSLQDQRTSFVDPAQSLVLPNPESSVSGHSSPTLSSYNVLSDSSDLEDDPWADLFSPYPKRSSYPQTFVDPPSLNGYYQRAPDNHIGLVFGSRIGDESMSTTSSLRENLWF
ncbi:hypothetical protein BJ165DRAFT_809565 [Panaeolus papilionaceus]|nr:hypothetical protein BJ165DRAFT_809565 [Panaeolus papilionaceus]